MKTTEYIIKYYNCLTDNNKVKVNEWLNFKTRKWYSQREYNKLKAELAWCYGFIGKENSTKFMNELFGDEK